MVEKQYNIENVDATVPIANCHHTETNPNPNPTHSCNYSYYLHFSYDEIMTFRIIVGSSSMVTFRTLTTVLN